MKKVLGIAWPGPGETEAVRPAEEAEGEEKEKEKEKTSRLRKSRKRPGSGDENRLPGSGDVSVVRLSVNSVRAGCPSGWLETGKNFKALMRSVEENGVINPICVYRTKNGQYEIVTGRRRLAAAKKAGLKEIPAVICGTDDDTRVILNFMREAAGNLDFFEEADNYRRVLESGEYSQKELAAELGKSQAYVSNKIRLLMLSPAVRRKVTELNLSERHARELVRLYDDKIQKMAAEVMAERYMTVTEAEEYVDAILSRTNRELQRNFKRAARLFKTQTGAFVASKNKAADNAEKLRQLIRAIREIVEIAKEGGLVIQAGQRKTDDDIELLIRIPKKANEVDLRRSELPRQQTDAAA